MWSPDQRYRLALEKKTLQRVMPQFEFFSPTRDTYVEGVVPPTVGSQVYRLKLELPPNYPYEKPSLFVSSPQVLWKHGNLGTINALNASHEFHTCAQHPSGCVWICFMNGWDASMTMIAIFLRGMFWVEGYAAHLRTGETIAEFINREKERIQNANRGS